MKLSRRFILGACFAAAVAPFLSAQNPSKVNFSGRWRMVKDKSDFAGFKMPDIIVRVVDQHDPTLNVHTVQTTGQRTTVADVSYFTDGSVTKNMINGREAESRCYWDGPRFYWRTYR
jgi:hypothetical protein